MPTYNLGCSNDNPYGYGAGDIPGATSTDVNTANTLLATLAGLISLRHSELQHHQPDIPDLWPARRRQNLSFNDYAGYVSDTWKLRPRLTVILGLRCDYFPPVAEANGLLIQPS